MQRWRWRKKDNDVDAAIMPFMEDKEEGTQLTEGGLEDEEFGELVYGDQKWWKELQIYQKKSAILFDEEFGYFWKFVK